MNGKVSKLLKRYIYTAGMSAAEAKTMYKSLSWGERTKTLENIKALISLNDARRKSGDVRKSDVE